MAFNVINQPTGNGGQVPVLFPMVAGESFASEQDNEAGVECGLVMRWFAFVVVGHVVVCDQ